jgi:hypothetical protein
MAAAYNSETYASVDMRLLNFAGNVHNVAPGSITDFSTLTF